MKLTVSLAQQGNLYPSVYNCLCSLPDGALHHTEHELRHPKGIYSRSFSRVTRALKAVLDENENIYQAPIDESGNCTFETDALLRAQQELLDALMAHIDDCYLILKAVYPAHKNKERKPAIFAHQWLSQAKHPTVKFFKDHITPYRETFAPIDNKIKHEHGRLRSVVMSHLVLPQESRMRIAGYFVEGVLENQILGPDRAIHQGKFAISFHHDLRYHFVHLYLVGQFLTQALINVIRTEYLPDYKPEPYVAVTQEEVEEIQRLAERIVGLPFLFYMNEVTKPIPAVRLLTTSEDMVLLLYEKLVFKTVQTLQASTLNPFRVTLQFEGDGVSRSWRLPYVGLQMKIVTNRKGDILEVSVTEK